MTEKNRQISNDRAALRMKLKKELAGLNSSAIAALEQRGYQVRGKTTAQIRLILKRHPTGPLSIP